jgi:photosystem II stability/assembly factor-like uncharacterized protein
MKKLILLFVIILISSSTLFGKWCGIIGLPDNEKATKIISNDNYIFIVSDKGRIYKSSNLGDVWIPTKQNGCIGANMNTLFTNKNILYLSGGGHFYKSTNNGDNWISTINEGLNFTDLNIFSINNNFICAGSKNEGIYISKDLGDHWNHLINLENELNKDSLSITAIDIQDSIIAIGMS